MVFMNGPEAFIHPVTGVRVEPFAYYEGNAHQEHEELEPVKEVKKSRKLDKKDEDKKGE